MTDLLPAMFFASSFGAIYDFDLNNIEGNGFHVFTYYFD